jgi:hypothetical protein
MRFFLASALAVLLAGCGSSSLEATTSTGGGGSGGAAGGGGSGGGGGVPAGLAAVCPEVDVSSYDCPINNYHDPLVAFVAASGMVFRGTVTALHEVTPGIAGTFDLTHTLIAHVDTMVWQAGTVLELTGQDVTVLMLSVPTMPVGYQGYFFATGLAYGQTVALGEIAHVDPGVYPTLESDVPGIVKLLAAEKLSARMSTAASVMVGTVSAITPIPGNLGSEHDPVWADATLTADCVMEGARPATTHAVFATSTDIAWFQSPKLTVGQQGVFLLQAAPLPPGDGGIPAGIPYTLTDPLDVHPLAERGQLGTLVLCPPWH